VKLSPPSSDIGSIALSLGALAAGTAAGAGAAALATPDDPTGTTQPKAQSAIIGGFLGLLTASFGGLLLEETSAGGKAWGSFGARTALLGVGAAAALGVASAVQSIGSYRQGLANYQANQPAQLPAVGVPGGPSYTATLANSGQTLTMAQGDTLAITYPTAPAGESWLWSVSGSLASYSGHTAIGGNETATFTASTPGTGQLVGKLTSTADSSVSQTFTLNLNVVTQPPAAA
jgi:hypothetical protein